MTGEETGGVVIMSDSTSDLSPELREKYNIAIVPLYVTLGSRTYRDGVDVQPDDLFGYFVSNGELPKTSAPTPGDYLEAFKPYIDRGKQIVLVTISSDFSCSYGNACIAAATCGGVWVVDSRNLSTGVGLVVLRGAELAAAGMGAKEIADELNGLTDRVESSFVIDTLAYLHKGGRCSSVAALGANLLRLKPCIEVENGKMRVGKKYKGSLSKCINQYVIDRLKDRNDIDTGRIFITHSSVKDENAELVRTTISQVLPFGEVLETTAGSTIASHCGPGTLGILFIRKKQEK